MHGVSYEKDFVHFHIFSVALLDLSYFQKKISMRENREKERRLEARDFPVREVNLGVADLRASKVPWPPRISTQPPSIFFWREAPEKSAGREEA